ncbi:MAG: methyltransferase [Candidatus Dormibacteraceae bacterium]
MEAEPVKRAAPDPLAQRRSLSTEQEVFMHEAAAAAAALRAADRLGVLAQLEQGPAGPALIARTCGISERGARGLLAALTSLGFADPAGDGTYRSPHPDIAVISAMVRQWDRLPDLMREDGIEPAADVAARAQTMYPKVATRLAAWFAPAAREAAEMLAARGLQVLDVGAGAAPWTLALVARAEGIRVTAVDLPTVIATTRQAVAAADRRGAFEYLAGDLFTVELRCGAYDLAIVANVCHLFGEDANRRLLARLLDALRPGGRLAILDALPDERLEGPRPVLLYALGLLTRTRSGQVYPFSKYASWLRETGYEAVDRAELGRVPLISLITARRPAG